MHTPINDWFEFCKVEVESCVSRFGVCKVEERGDSICCKSMLVRLCMGGVPERSESLDNDVLATAAAMEGNMRTCSSITASSHACNSSGDSDKGCNFGQLTQLIT